MQIYFPFLHLRTSVTFPVCPLVFQMKNLSRCLLLAVPVFRPANIPYVFILRLFSVQLRLTQYAACQYLCLFMALMLHGILVLSRTSIRFCSVRLHDSVPVPR